MKKYQYINHKGEVESFLLNIMVGMTVDEPADVYVKMVTTTQTLFNLLSDGHPVIPQKVFIDGIVYLGKDDIFRDSEGTNVIGFKCNGDIEDLEIRPTFSITDDNGVYVFYVLMSLVNEEYSKIITDGIQKKGDGIIESALNINSEAIQFDMSSVKSRDFYGNHYTVTDMFEYIGEELPNDVK